MQWIDDFDNAWMPWLVALHKSQTHDRVLLMLDSVFMPGLLRRLNQARHDMNKAAALFGRLRGCSDEALAVTPLVIEFNPDDAALIRVLRECQGKPMVTAIVTTDTPAQLADRLARWCVVEVTGSAFNFRFPDTRRLPAIARTLRPGQRADMLGPAAQWYCVNRHGRWEQLLLAPADVDPAETAKLDDEQFALLLRDSEADEMVASLTQEFSDAWRLRTPSAHYEIASKALHMADAQLIEDPGARLDMVAAAFKTTSLEALV